MTPATLVFRVLLPFAAGFYLNYLYRVINALIAPELRAELGLGAADLGLMTAVLFLTWAAAALPVGVLLDRFGPRRVQAALLLVAALGAVIFAAGSDLWTLTFARALIGIGISGTFLAAVKAIAYWFPKDRIALANGALLTLGTLGAVTATLPADLLVQSVGWRGLFLIAAGFTVLVSATSLFAPRSETKSEVRLKASLSVISGVFGDRKFLCFAPLAALSVAIPWAMQGLWAGRWLADVQYATPDTVVAVLFVMACCMSAGGIIIGIAADRLRQKGIPISRTFAWLVLLQMAIEALILTRWPLSDYALWGGAAIFAALNGLNFAMVSELYAKEMIGRANSVLAVFNIGCAFVVQSSVGFVIELWPQTATGSYPPLAYEVAFSLPLLAQATAFAWFVLGRGVASQSADVPTSIESAPKGVTG